MMRVLFFLLTCFRLAGQEYTFPFNLRAPLREVVLPPVLQEISGITEIDSVTIACVQDEKGIVFLYDLEQNKIVRELPVAPDGDYEAIARAGKALYLLRSDGSIFEVPDWKRKPTEMTLHMNQVPSTDNEGLCYDASKKRLLLSSKGAVETESWGVRPVYALDHKTMKLAPRPAYRFDIESVTGFAVERKLMEAYRYTPKGKAVPDFVKLHISEIAIHPLTGDLYVLSANDRMLLVFEKSGKLRHIEKLDPEKFNKPEGLTFLGNGDLLITNEGEEGWPRLYWFKKKNDDGRG